MWFILANSVRFEFGANLYFTFSEFTNYYSRWCQIHVSRFVICIYVDPVDFIVIRQSINSHNAILQFWMIIIIVQPIVGFMRFRKFHVIWLCGFQNFFILIYVCSGKLKPNWLVIGHRPSVISLPFNHSNPIFLCNWSSLFEWKFESTKKIFIDVVLYSYLRVIIPQNGNFMSKL